MKLPQEIIWIALAIPLFYLYCIQFTKNTKHYLKGVAYIVLVEYVAFLLCFAVIFRESFENKLIQRKIFWSYINPTDEIIRDNFINVFVFIPIGILVSIISKKYTLLNAFLLGLLVSETIECSQIIFRRGTFDVDDIINNTAGALIGAIIFCFTKFIWRFVNK